MWQMLPVRLCWRTRPSHRPQDQPRCRTRPPRPPPPGNEQVLFFILNTFEQVLLFILNKSSYFSESVAFDIYLVVAEPVAGHIAKRKRVARLSLTNAITREHKIDVVNGNGWSWWHLSGLEGIERLPSLSSLSEGKPTLTKLLSHLVCRF